MAFPRMYRIRQKFEATRVADVPGEVRRQLGKLDLANKVKPGQTVAITAGSRGIANIAEIIKACVDHFKSLGATPFIVPAMGSHGGGTAAGQREIIEHYGITEEFTGAEIRASMETVIVAQTPQGIPVHFDKHASQADHVLVVGRVKPHTGFVGEIESGLHKMMLIGLGKHEGAKIYHRAIQDHSWLEIVTAVADKVLERCNVIAGLAIVENAYDETALLAAVPPAEFLQREKELLVLAKQWMPRLPFPQIDLLIIDEIGKNISGSGMDTNVIGRKFRDHYPTQLDEVAVKRIFVRGLTDETHGNACGIGIAEFTNQRTIDAADLKATWINVLTGGHPTAGALPIAFETDREVVETALTTVGLTEPEDTRVVHISDTLHVGEVLVSEAYRDEIDSRDDLEIIDGPTPMEFDDAGNLFPVAAAGELVAVGGEEPDGGFEA
jgi:Lactate racemase N-terminal domain